MLRSLHALKGYSIQTIDGHMGKVNDFYLDDKTWTVRYLVVDTGNWLPGRLVLISPYAFEKPNWEQNIFPLNLTKQQIEESPSIEDDKPVSRQLEVDLFDYYDWAPYWIDMGIDRGMALDQSAVASYGNKKRPTLVSEKPADVHLQSMRSVIGYRIKARDGEIGHIDDFIVDDELWAIRYMVLDTKNWWPGKKVLIASEWIGDLKGLEATAAISMLTKEAIKNSPPFNPSMPINKEYEAQFYDYYGRPHMGKKLI